MSLRLVLSAFVSACLGITVGAEQPTPALDEGLTTLLSFEREPVGGLPGGWRGGPAGTLHRETEHAYRGGAAARLERSSESPQRFSTFTTSLPLDVRGARIELRGYLRTRDVAGFAGLWLRIDGAEGVLAFDNMQKRQIDGTRDWTEYAINLSLPKEGRSVFFGALLSGTGTVWADELQLLVDGQPIWQAPRAVREATSLDRDQAFIAGSGFAADHFTADQTEHLAWLGEVWGFLKYHHPRVTAGELHWDFELFRILPGLLAAPDRASAQDLLVRWVEALGPVETSQLPDPARDVHLPAERWFDDQHRLGPALAAALVRVHHARTGEAKQFYLEPAPGVGNPRFTHEPAYSDIVFPDTGYQLLALFRFWNIIRYWFPYRDLLDENWNDVLRDSLTPVGLARTRDEYQLALLRVIARVHDTHANLWSSLEVRPPRGEAQVPAIFRWIEGRPVVYRLLPTEETGLPGLRRGDRVLALEGRPVDELVEAWLPYYAASNAAARYRDMARFFSRGPEGPVTLTLDGPGGGREITLQRERVAPEKVTRLAHDLPGPAFRKLTPDVAYLKLSAVKQDEVASYVAEAGGTKGWILDLRNYPSDFVVFTLGGHFVAESTPFVRFTSARPAHPGRFDFGSPLHLRPRPPLYSGRLIILVDEATQSSAEYHAMAFRAAPGAMVMGSTTAGADGNVSQIPLPGGLHAFISGIGVFYPDRRPTQRVGIVPDLEVRPTAAGIRAGRDEVLEAALREMLGPAVSSEELARLAQPE